MPEKRKYKRRIKLVDRGLQGKIILAFMATAVFSVTLQVIVVAGVMSQAIINLPDHSSYLLQQLDWMLMGIFLIALGVTLPLTYLVALNLTFRIVGPLYRFRVFLREVKAGLRPVDCRIRKEDDLQDFCKLLNEVTAPLRARDAGDEDEGEDEQREGQGDELKSAA